MITPEIEPDGACQIPPAGWWCSRAPGHSGPCAAHPATAEAEAGVIAAIISAHVSRHEGTTIVDSGSAAAAILAYCSSIRLATGGQ